MLREPEPKSLLSSFLSTHCPHDTIVKPCILFRTLRNKEVASDLCVHGVMCVCRSPGIAHPSELQNVRNCFWSSMNDINRYTGDTPWTSRNTLFKTPFGVPISWPRILLPTMPGSTNAPPFRRNLTSHPQECGLPLWPQQGSLVRSRYSNSSTVPRPWGIQP